MPMSVAECAYRTLRRMPRYHGAGPARALLVAGPALTEAEMLVGVYENQPGQLNERLVITTRGLHLYRDARWQFIAFNQIERAAAPAEKRTADHLTLWLRSGEQITLPIRGSDDRVRDAFEFLQFIDKVIR